MDRWIGSTLAIFFSSLNVGVTGQRQQSTAITLHGVLYVLSLLTFHGNLKRWFNTQLILKTYTCKDCSCAQSESNKHGKESSTVRSALTHLEPHPTVMLQCTFAALQKVETLNHKVFSGLSAAS